MFHSKKLHLKYIVCHVKRQIFVDLSFMCLYSYFCLSEMKGKDFTRAFLGLTCIAVLVQNICCRLNFETNTQFCCEKSSNSSGFSCWNRTLEDDNVQNTSTFANCRQNKTNTACFNVTEIQPCQDDSGASVMHQGKKEIHIGAFVPFLKDDRYGHSTAMKMAIDIINNRSDILDNYTLVLDSEDTVSVSTELAFC